MCSAVMNRPGLTIFVLLLVFQDTVNQLNLLRNFFSGNLPPEIAAQVTGILTDTLTLPPVFQCPQISQSNIKFQLYTRSSLRRPITLNPANPSEIEKGKPIKIVIHGWLSSPNSFGFQEIKNAYLKRYDCSVIMVDWSIPAWNVYKKAYCAVPQIGRMLADFLCLIQETHSIYVNSVHMVGHSFGAQMSAFTGQTTRKQCGKKVGRITAMDPARPHYQGIPTHLRLDKDDAEFVDVIHTNDGVFGYFGDCGHADFYVNCGSLQPGCPEIMPTSWVDHPIAAVSCEHFRSVEFMAESISPSSRKFKGKLCSICHGFCHADSAQKEEVVMGEDCPKTASGSFVVFTNAYPPYAQG